MDLKGRLYFRCVGQWAAQSSRLIVTVSESAKRDIVRSVGVPERKVRVVHEGIDDTFKVVSDLQLLRSVRTQYRLPDRFILAVGTLEPRKNLPALIQAYRTIRRSSSTQLGLVIAGRTGWKATTLQQEADGDDVTFTGFVPQQHLVALYNLAEMFVLPSLYEGFGFPPLEAMACGCPVIVSNRGSLPEVVGDAAILIDPEREESIAAAIRMLEGNHSLRVSLIGRGFERIKSFSWKSTAKHTEALYKQVVSAFSGNQKQNQLGR